MPKLKKKIDDYDLEILAALYYFGPTTGFKISKITRISRGTVSKRLKDMVKDNILSEPKEDTSSGRLKKIYFPLGRKDIENLFLDYWKRGFYDFIYSEEERKERDLRETYTEYLGDELEWVLSLKELKSLEEGVHISNFLDRAEEDEEFEADVMNIFRHETAGHLEVKNKIVKLSEKGLRKLVERKKESIKNEYAELKEISKDEALNLLEEIKRFAKS